MILPVEFDHESFFCAIEIHYEIQDAVLPSELPSLQFLLLQMGPQKSLCGGTVTAEFLTVRLKRLFVVDSAFHFYVFDKREAAV